MARVKGMTSNLNKILVADDDSDMLNLIRMECEEEGFCVETASNGQEAIIKIRETDLLMAVLDWDMPFMSGFDICKRLRQQGNQLPILMVTAKDDVEDRILALDAGADDYVCKPFNIRELLARVNALARRVLSSPESSEILTYDCIEINKAQHECTIDGKSVHLTVREFDLLSALLIHPNQVLTRGQLIQTVWGDDYFGDESVVDTYIRYLRKKITSVVGSTEFIQTIRGVGYTLKRL